MEKKTYRHEFKYICSEAQLACLKGRLSGIMRFDPHADGNGKYRIRSVYFDDYLKLTGTDRYPVGYVRSATIQERQMLERMAEDYDVDSKYVLDMYRHGKVTWVTDMLLRFGVLVVVITIITVVWDSIKKRKDGQG